MQTTHATQLEEMRKAGHDALVLIVEEYKVTDPLSLLFETSNQDLNLAINDS